MNELFFLLFLSFFLFNSTIIIDFITNYSFNLLFFFALFFAVPKKKNKKPTILKKKLLNKCLSIRQTNIKSVHFDEFFNNIQK